MGDDFRRGLSHGIPIALGYFSVSIGFGLLATNGGLSPLEAVLVSALNLTSAGQLAGVQVMFAAGTLAEMAVTQLFINMRYALMSIALSQKIDQRISLPGKLSAAFFITDEIFAVASSQPAPLRRAYLWGLALLPLLGWTLGTCVGAMAGALLPAVIRNGLGIAIYGMFLAIIVPPARSWRPIRVAVCLAAGLSCLMRFAPGLRAVPGGFSLVLCALAASVYCAWKHPIQEAR